MNPYGNQGPPPPPNHQQWQAQEHPSPAQHHSTNGAPNGYPPPPLPSIQPPQSSMAASQYHLPTPHRHDIYGRHHMAPQYPYPQAAQPAPRQRTAIACRYCRRRKIRCSGFDNSEDGRCQNCTRFSQECVFTPVSAQAQAFVPAHTLYGRGAHPAGAQLYGAYGQPLPPSQQPTDPYGRGAPQPYPVTSPTGPYPGPPAGYVPAPAPIDVRNGTHSRKRPSDEPHTPGLAPPPPGASRPEHDYRYPDPTALAPAGAVSPASSNASYQSAPQQNNQQTPYYTQPPPSNYPPFPGQTAPRRPSPPGAAYNHDSNRASSSPNSQGAYDASLRPPSNHPQSRTPPPNPSAGGMSPQQQGGSGGAGRPAMSISSIVSGQGGAQAGAEGASPGTRSAADSDMLNRLR